MGLSQSFAFVALGLRYQVALVPGIAFGDTKCLRLSYAATKENITEAGQKRWMRLLLVQL